MVGYGATLVVILLVALVQLSRARRQNSHSLEAQRAHAVAAYQREEAALLQQAADLNSQITVRPSLRDEKMKGGHALSVWNTAQQHGLLWCPLSLHA